MSFSRSLKGNFESVRQGLTALVEAQRAEDVKNGASETVIAQHELQATAAAQGLEHVLARIPDKHNGFQGFDPKTGNPVEPSADAEITVSIYGAAAENGLSGSFGGSYTITSAS